MWLHYVPLMVVVAVAWSSSAIAFPQNDQLFDSNATPQSNPVTFGADGFIFDGPADTISRAQTTASTSTSTSTATSTSTSTSTSTTASSVTTNNPRLQQCITSCPMTTEYNPVCGTDGVDYTNPGELSCAQLCGKDVALQYYGRCITSNMRG